MSDERKNVHITLTPEEADELVAGELTGLVQAKTEKAIGKAVKLERAMESARQLHAEGKLTPVDLSQHKRRDDLLRVVWRQPDGEECRCATFIPLPDDPNLRAGLAAAVPPFSVYTYQEAERMVEEDRS